jgi:DNA topoisomerase-3
MTTAVVAEKPSVARDIAGVLGASQRGEGHYHGNGYVITWAIGRLVALALPPQMRADWKRWDLAQLPMIPERWSLVVLEGTRAQFEVVRRRRGLRPDQGPRGCDRSASSSRRS